MSRSSIYSRFLVLATLLFLVFQERAFAQGTLANGANETGSIASATQIDTWTFGANKGDFFEVSVSETGPNTAFVPFVRVTGPDGSNYGYSAGDLSAQVLNTAGLTGTYTVAVQRNDNSNVVGNYLLTLAKAPGTFVVPSGDEGGALTNGQNYSGTLLRGDLDMWSFSANKGDFFEVSISEQGANTAFVPFIRVIGPDGSNYGYSAGDLSAQVINTAGLTGTFTVVVQRNDNADGVGDYSLTLAKAPGSFVVPEGDEGGTLTNGQNYSGTLLRGDLDMWSFSANKGDFFEVSISEQGANTAFVPFIRVIGPDGSNYGYSAGDLSAQVINTAGLSGTYTVLVQRNDNADGVGNYLVTLAKTPGAIFVPPGDQGGPMTNGQNYSGTLLRGDLDQWSFSANKGEFFEVSVSEQGANTAFVPFIRVIGPDGSNYGYSAGDLSAQVVNTAGLTGTYTVLVQRNDDADGTGNYLLTLAKAPGTFIVPSGDEGGPMVDGQNYSGTLLRGDLDLWNFNANKGDVLTVTVNEQGANTAFVPFIRLIGPDGSNYGYAAGDTSAQVHNTAGLTGTYTVLVQRNDNADGVGEYLLTLTGATGAPPPPSYLLSLGSSPSAGGSVAASPASDGSYPSGTKVCLSATPASGYVFSGWSGSSLDSSDCLTVTTNESVVANFEQITALRFIPVTPCRLADTRNPNGAFGGPALTAGSTREFVVPNNTTCNIPNTAEAYSLNVTVVPTAKLQYLTVWPTGESQPGVSLLNSFDGRIKANAAIVPAGSEGAVSVYATDATNVIVDIDGYFVPKSNTSALGFYPVKPCRIADTRSGSGAFGEPSLIAKQERTFPVLSSSCNLPSTAKAYSLNFTAVPKSTLGYLTVWPTGQGQPNVSTLNAPTGTVTANAAIVPAGSSGSIDVYASDATDLIIDVNGYFAAPTSNALSLYNLTPCRVLDTRNPKGSAPFSGKKTVNAVASSCGVPAGSQALVFNATVVPPGSLTYLTLWSDGQTQPTVSTLNAEDGAVTSNLAIVPDNSGVIDAFASNPTHLILDISGYFAP